MPATRARRVWIGSTALCAAAFVFAACDGAVHPVEPAVQTRTAEAEPAPVLFSRSWGGNQQWEFLHSAPLFEPDARVVRIYQIAPVNAYDPLSEPLDIPGVISVGGRDHVTEVPPAGRRILTGLGNTVPVLHPHWSPSPPWDEASCNVFGGPAEIEHRIAWQRTDPAPHPCGWGAVVFGAKLEGDACVRPLTSVARIEAAVAQGLVALEFPPEPGAWAWVVRPLTDDRRVPVVVEAPTCVPAGERTTG